MLVRFADFQTRAPILMELNVDPSITLASLRDEIKDHFCTEGVCKWHLEVKEDSALGMMELTSDDNPRTLAALGMEDSTTIYLDGPIYENIPPEPSYYLSKYPSQPMKALWEALGNSSVGADAILCIVLDPRCGLEYRSTAADGQMSVEGSSEDLNSRGGCTALMMAAMVGRYEVITALIAAGAEVISTDKDCRTPLHIAEIYGQTACAELLIAKGADVESMDENGRTPLHLAAIYGHTACAEHLIAKGADVNAAEKYGQTPLKLAAMYGHTAFAELLIAKGADVNAVDEYGWTPLKHAAMYHYTAFAELLIAQGADVNVIDEYGQTPLKHAAVHGHAALAELLIAGGADVNAVDEDGRTPLHFAAENGHTACAELLIAAGAM